MEGGTRYDYTAQRCSPFQSYYDSMMRRCALTKLRCLRIVGIHPYFPPGRLFGALLALAARHLHVSSILSKLRTQDLQTGTASVCVQGSLQARLLKVPPGSELKFARNLSAWLSVGLCVNLAAVIWVARHRSSSKSSYQSALAVWRGGGRGRWARELH